MDKKALRYACDSYFLAEKARDERSYAEMTEKRVLEVIKTLKQLYPRKERWSGQEIIFICGIIFTEEHECVRGLLERAIDDGKILLTENGLELAPPVAAKK